MWIALDGGRRQSHAGYQIPNTVPKANEASATSWYQSCDHKGKGTCVTQFPVVCVKEKQTILRGEEVQLSTYGSLYSSNKGTGAEEKGC